MQILKFVDGAKTYLLGLAFVLIGALEMVGVDVVADVTAENAFTQLQVGLGLIAGRSAIKKLEV